MINMQIEYEATFSNIDKVSVRKTLRDQGAVLLKKEFTQKRKNFFPPAHLNPENAFMRVRDEGDKITMALKIFEGDGIERQKETEIYVKDFGASCELVENLGMKQQSFQETRRELWEINGVKIMIDEWPFLEPFIEVEGGSELGVRQVSEKLGFDWGEAIFGAVSVQYAKKYNIPEDRINSSTPKLIFNMENPFVG
jgi:adenylate cyclase class 2